MIDFDNQNVHFTHVGWETDGCPDCGLPASMLNVSDDVSYAYCKCGAKFDFVGTIKPHVWVWQSYDTCMDVYCDCGQRAHFDTDFFYYYECPKCKKCYSVGQTIELTPMTKEQVDEVMAAGGEIIIGEHYAEEE